MDLAKVRPFFLTQFQKLHSQPVYHYPEKKIHNIQLPRNSVIAYRLNGMYSRITMTIGFDIDVWMPIIVNHTDIVWDRYETEISIALIEIVNFPYAIFAI